MQTTENATAATNSVPIGAGLSRKAAFSSSPICRVRPSLFLTSSRNAKACVIAARCWNNYLKYGGQPPSSNSPEMRKAALQGDLFEIR